MPFSISYELSPGDGNRGYPVGYPPTDMRFEYFYESIITLNLLCLAIR